MKKQQLLALISEYADNLPGKAEKSFIISELEEYIHLYHGENDNDVLFSEFVANYSGKGDESDSGEVDKSDKKHRSLEDELRNADAQTKKLLAHFEEADRSDTVEVHAKKRKIIQVENGGMLDDAPAASIDYFVTEEPTEDAVAKNTAEFSPSLLHQLFQDETRNILPQVMGKLDSQGLRSLGKTSKFFARKLFYDPQYWYDKLLKLGINKEHLDEIIDAKIIKNYHNFFYSFINYLRATRRNESYTITLKDSKLGVWKLSTPVPPTQKWELICLSGNIEEIKKIENFDRLYNVHQMYAYDIACLSVNLSAAEHLYNGLITGQYNNTREVMLNYQPENSLLNLANLAYIIKSGNVKALEMIINNQFEINLDLKWFIKKTTGHSVTPQGRASNLFYFAFMSNNNEMVRFMYTVLKRYGYEPANLLTYTIEKNCVFVAVATGNETILNFIEELMSPPKFELYVAQNLDSLITHTIHNNQAKLFARFMRLHLKNLSTKADIDKACIDVIYNIASTINSKLIVAFLKELTGLYIEKMNENSEWKNEILENLVSSRNKAIEMQFEKKEITEEQRDMRITAPLTSKYIFDNSFHRISLTATGYLLSNKNKTQDPKCTLCLLELGYNFKKLLTQDIWPVINHCIIRNNIPKLKFVIDNLKTNPDQFKIVLSSLAEYLLSAAANSHYTTAKTYPSLEIFYSLMRDAKLHVKFGDTVLTTLTNPLIFGTASQLKWLMDNHNSQFVKFNLAAIKQFLNDDNNFENLILMADVELLKKIIGAGLLDSKRVTSNNENIYLLAAKCFQPEIMRFALEELGCDKNSITKNGKCALSLAAQVNRKTEYVSRARILQTFTYLRKVDVKLGSYAETKKVVLKDLEHSSSLTHCAPLRQGIREILNKPQKAFEPGASTTTSTSSQSRNHAGPSR